MYEKFEELCAKKGVTPYRVSKETGISTATLTSWKQGKYNPKPEKLKVIADYFHVPLSHFYNETSKINIAKLLTEKDKIKKYFPPNTVYAKFIDETEVCLHSEIVCEFVKLLGKMSEDDIDLLITTAKRINPTEDNVNNIVSFSQSSNDEEKKNSKLFTDVQSAKAYLEGKSIAAFGGGKILSDEAIIEMANIVFNDNQK